MPSTFVPITDEELREKIREAGGEVMVATWSDARTGRFIAGLRNITRGGALGLSTHDDVEAATKARMRSPSASTGGARSPN